MEKIKNFEELSAKCSVCADAYGKKIEGGSGKRAVVLCGGTGCISSNSLEIKAKFEKLIDALEDIDDVQDVYHNVDLPCEEE